MLTSQRQVYGRGLGEKHKNQRPPCDAPNS